MFKPKAIRLNQNDDPNKKENAWEKILYLISVKANNRNTEHLPYRKPLIAFI